MKPKEIEQEIQDKGLTAPRVTPAAVAISASDVWLTPRSWKTRSAASRIALRVS